MNDLIIPTEFDKAFPTMAEGLRKAWVVFQSVKSFEDIERIFLRGIGLSAHTYQSYLTSVKQLYEFTNGKHPLQITVNDLDAFYDDLLKRGVGRNTAYIRIAGLKCFFKNLNRVPGLGFYTSPFDLMNKKLKKKISRTKKSRTKKALGKSELNKLLAKLEEDKSVYGRQNHAMILTLATTGLRAFELCQLQWKNLEYYPDEKRYFITFIGKGGGQDRQEIREKTLKVIRANFKYQFKRKPQNGDYLFYGLEKFGREPQPMKMAALWQRLHKIGQAVREEGLITRNIQFSAHLFRRTFASLLYKAGMDLKSLQLATRHQSIEVLAKHYIDSEESTAPYWDKILEAA